MYKNIALVLAGGSGSRLSGVGIPKQFIEVNQKPIIAYTLEAFAEHEEIDAIVVVVGELYKGHMQDIVCKYGIKKVVSYAASGNTRGRSTYSGLLVMSDITNDDTTVLIHDGARPLISKEIISENIHLVHQHRATTTAIPSSDTILKSDSLDRFVSYTLDRNGLFCVQTPQSFVYADIRYAHEQANEAGDVEFTDDSALYSRYFQSDVAIAKGSRLNFKITVQDDLKIFKALISNE